MRRIVHENVETPELAHGPIDQGATMARLLDVARHQHRLAPGLLDPATGLPRVLFFREIGSEDVRPLARESNRHRSSDPPDRRR